MRLLLLFILTLSACTKNHEAGYFPLQKGLHWQYDVTQVIGGESTTREFSIENYGRTHLNGQYENEEIYLRRTSDGTDYYILRDDTGSYRVGKRTIVELKPRMDSPERKILPSQIDIALGAIWTAETSLYVSRTRIDINLSDQLKQKVNMLYEVVDLDATVELPSGVYEHCTVVKGKAAVSIYADPKVGSVEVPVTQTEWYAPGVGLVKMVREEQLSSDIYEGGTLTFELSHFKR